MNNTVYGKTMEKIRNRIDVRFVSNKKYYLKWTLFDNNSVVILKSNVTLKLNKSAHVRMCILVLNKALVYEFHYDYIINKYGNNSRFLFTDADSLIYDIKTEDGYENFSKDKNCFDFSNYLAKSKYNYDLNELVVVKMKDEMGTVAVEEFA